MTAMCFLTSRNLSVGIRGMLFLISFISLRLAAKAKTILNFCILQQIANLRLVFNVFKMRLLSYFIWSVVILINMPENTLSDSYGGWRGEAFESEQTSAQLLLSLCDWNTWWPEIMGWPWDISFLNLVVGICLLLQ